MDMDLLGFLEFHREDASGLVSTDAGRSLSDKELRAYCRWGVRHGFRLLSELPEFEDIESELDIC